MKILIYLSRRLNDSIQYLVSTLGIIMTIVVASQVFSRYVLNHSLFWSEELARLILVWLTFFGATVAYYHGLHPGVDTIFRHLSENLRRVAELISYLADMVLFTVMVTWGTKLAWFVRLQITPPMGIYLIVSASISEQSIGAVSRRVVPFLLVLIVDLLLISFYSMIKFL